MEYLGIYDEPYIEFHTVKIRAVDRESAEVKFEKYLQQKGVKYIAEDKLYIIPLIDKYIETIE